ncbi:Uncharacterised protein [Mycobacteroides abscessus subsp. abscessus]|nr:Uncharacterised protein [Mycobacteroides abscessus subsp. abscessus]
MLLHLGMMPGLIEFCQKAPMNHRIQSLNAAFKNFRESGDVGYPDYINAAFLECFLCAAR